jgi:malonate-semialdehyde dehydrogenase (acetylating)/methylmalonate-semialdehyde dehydrogenase
VHDPATQAVVARTPRTTPAEFASAVAAARRAFPAWRDTPLPARQRVMLRLQALIRAHEDELATVITREQGKTLADARGDVFRGLEVVEYAAGLAPSLMGDYVEHVATGIDSYSLRQPLGVAAGVCPFNFPAMVGLWMWPLAVTAGNTFLLKPSERVPSAANMLAELALEAGLPK